MFEERLLREFAKRFQHEVSEVHEELPEGMRLPWDVALTQAAMGYISDTGAASTDDLCPHEDTEGRDRCKVIAYSLDEDERRLMLFTSLHRGLDASGNPATLPRDEVQKWCHWAARYFRHAVAKSVTRFSGNDAAYAAAKEIRAKLSKIDTVLVTFITDARVRDRSVEGTAEIGKEIQFEVWDVERLQRAAEDEIGRERIEVDFTRITGRPLPVLESQPPAKEYGTFLAIMPGNVLYALYEEYGAKLFEFNVRSFLQATGKVNKGIRATLNNDEERERFLAYNNGITATADEIDVGQEHGQTVIRSLKGLQIVNGAQTTASIHRARKQDKVNLDHVAVAMKLTRVEPTKLAEFVPLISRFANTQNPVQAADLSANSPFHIRLEQLAQATWCPGEESRWFYERARGAYQVARNRLGSTKAKRAEFDTECPKAQRFGKTELAKAWMAWWGMPNIVARGSQKNYTEFMGELQRRHEADWQPDASFLRRTAALLMLWKAAQRACKKADLGSYAANVVALMMAVLGQDHGEGFDLEWIWDSQAVSDELASTLLEWAPHIHAALRVGAGTDNVTEYAKKEASWDTVRKTNLIWPAQGVPETTIGDGETPDKAEALDDDAVPDERPDAADEGADANAVECMALDGVAWGRVMTWAASAKTISSFDRTIAASVFQRALNGWDKPATPKMAYYAVRVLRAAKKAGVLGQQAA